MIVLIVIALAAYVGVALLFKAGALRVPPDRLITVALLVVSLIAAIMMALRSEWGGTWAGLGIALLSGALFYVGSLFRVKALQTTPVSLVFAVTNLDLVLSGVVALVIPAFGQTFTPWHLLAIAAAGGAMFVGTQMRGVERFSIYTFISLAILSLSSLGFVIYARWFSSALLFFILFDHLAGLLLNGRALLSTQRSDLGWGIALGICMFVGFWALLQAIALSNSNVTLVLLAISLKTPLIAIAAVPVFREPITRHKLAAVALATLALVLWEIGTSFS